MVLLETDAEGNEWLHIPKDYKLVNTRYYIINDKLVVENERYADYDRAMGVI